MIAQFEATDWPANAVALISDNIISVLDEKGKCSVLLTGGSSAARLYAAWRILPIFHLMTGLSFYFGAERCVPPGHPESNYWMAIQILFQHGVPEGCPAFRMPADATDREAAAQQYADQLPARLALGATWSLDTGFAENTSRSDRGDDTYV